MAIHHLRSESTAGGRRHRFLSPFVHPAEVAAILEQQPFDIASSDADADVLRRASEAAASLSSYRIDPVREVPDSIRAATRAIVESSVFDREYARQGATGIGMVSLDTLITPQPIADFEYVEELAARAPEPGDLDGAVRFVFPQGQVPEPAVIGNTVMFKTAYQSIFVSPIPRFRPSGEGYEVVVDVRPRPNLLYVASMPSLGGRQLVINGVHHILALMDVGWKEVPAVIRPAMTIEELGLGQTSILQTTGMPRPALVADFFGPAAIELRRRPTALAWRIAIQSDQLMFPD